MLQEIITYTIVALAVTLAVIKTIKKFSRKKNKTKINFKKESFSMEHNCSDCSAECMLRDATAQMKDNANCKIAEKKLEGN